jgi:hypothetical protein
MSSLRHNIVMAVAGADANVRAWWQAMSVLAALNICMWLAVIYFVPVDGVYAGLHVGLSGVYVLVCAYRSVLPRVDLERLVVVDSPFSSIFLGRTAATVAEICFAIQLGLLVHQLGVHTNTPLVQAGAWAIPVFMVVAQGFCWHSVLTLNHITQAVESMLWGAGFTWMAALLAIIAFDSTGWVTSLAVFGVLCSVGFVTYVLGVDVPMYLRRYRRGRQLGHAYMRLDQGALDAWNRRVRSGSWIAWRSDALWLTPYFSLGVWSSIAMALVPVT